MFVGYARDGGGGQSLELQLRALSDAGCAKIFSEQNDTRPAGARDALQGALDFVRPGDTLVIARLEPVSSYPNDVHRIIACLAGSGISLRSLDESRVKSGSVSEAAADAVAVSPARAPGRPHIPH